MQTSLPPYSCKYSNHIYTQHQHIALLCLKERLRLKYREFVQLVDLTPKIKKILGLKKTPHFTTLQKFFQRFGSGFFEDMLSQTVELFDIKEPWIAIDGTGHSSNHASLYYAKKLKKQKKNKRKSYTKNQIVVDTDNQVILAHRISKGPRHDARDAIPLIRKTKRFNPKGYSMDKAYDSEDIHKTIREEVKAESMIPLKNRAKKGKYRLAMLEEFDEGKYHKRSLAETVISVEKRVFGDTNHSRSDRLRNKESKLRNICYNMYRRVKIFILKILKGFYRAIIL